MASKTKKPTRKTPSRRAAVKKKMSEVVKQAKEPLSLLSTLREEGLANAMMIMTLASSVASGATRNFRADAVKPQLRELVNSLGFALRSDLEKLESRIEDLEQKISEKEFADIRDQDEE
jgi:polyhydroxyalkanoate synthesis regulator phasin